MSSLTFFPASQKKNNTSHFSYFSNAFSNIKVRPSYLGETFFTVVGFLLFYYYAYNRLDCLEQVDRSYVGERALAPLKLLNQAYSLLHALVIVWFSFFYLVQQLSFQQLQRGLAFTRGYLIATIFIGWLHPEEFDMNFNFLNSDHLNEKLMVIHHIVLFVLTFLCEYYEPKFLALGLLSELTNYPFTAAWLMYKASFDLYYPNYLIGMGALLLLSYGVFRVLNFSYLLYLITQRHLLYGLAFFPLVAINYYWFYCLLLRFLAL